MDPRRHPPPPKRSSESPHASAPVERRTPRRHWRRLGHTLLALALALTTVTLAEADELERRIDDSLALCAAAERLAPEARQPMLARGLELADAALALDARSVRAHFAVVCNLGKTASLRGVGLGTLGAVYRLRREVDMILTLAPDDSDALTAKGALLMRLPRWLGGNRSEGERWLRRALAIDPLNTTARAYLDETENLPGSVAPAADTVIAR